MADTCDVVFVHDQDAPTLTCDKPARFHLIHHDPATGVRYLPHWRGIFDLCGLFRHRPTCPLATTSARPGRRRA